MSTKFYTLLTELGAAKLANSAALGVPLNITQMAVGDGGGVLPTPNAQQTELLGETRRAALNRLYIDRQNPGQIIAEQIIPENVGGWWIREIGLYDVDGALIAIANCPESYKPILAEGSGRTQMVRMVLIVSSTEAVTLKVDPSVVLATREYVDDEIIEVRSYTDSQLASHLSAADPHTQYLKIVQIDHYLPAGVPQPWPQATPPAGWLKCNGAAFDTARYPLLATAYPAGILPDLRGEFIRGWDDGREVDAGRGVLSGQTDAIRNITGIIPAPAPWSYEQHAKGALGGSHLINGGGSVPPVANGYGIALDVSRVVPTAIENRPRNIAFNYIVRAA